MRLATALLLTVTLFVPFFTGCDDESTSTQENTCEDGLIFDAATGDCFIPTPDVVELDTVEDTTPVEVPDTVEEDTATDTIDPSCDKDNDGALSIECGGDDCDDEDLRRYPGNTERCDEVDNDCNDRINDGVECGFYAHTARELFQIDPFTLEIEKIADLPEFGGLVLNDIDTHPDGTLYGITQEAIFVYVESAKQWFLVEVFSNAIENATGMAFGALGTAYITAANDVYSINPQVGSSEVVGSMGKDSSGTDYRSSGDCVVNKTNTLYMTSRRFGDSDLLVQVDRDTAAVTEIGAIGFEKVYGLTFANGILYGMTSNGEMIDINYETGEGTLIKSFPEQSWYGAASTPGR